MGTTTGEQPSKWHININGGTGSDSLYVRSKDGVREFVSCGPGNDHIVADAVDSLSSC